MSARHDEEEILRLLPPIDAADAAARAHLRQALLAAQSAPPAPPEEREAVERVLARLARHRRAGVPVARRIGWAGAVDGAWVAAAAVFAAGWAALASGSLPGPLGARVVAAAAAAGGWWLGHADVVLWTVAGAGVALVCTVAWEAPVPGSANARRGRG